MKQIAKIENENEILIKQVDELKNDDDDLEERVSKLEELAKAPGTLRSCFEYSQYGVESDGDYFIDPDGINVGYPPFIAFCNFTAGTTEIYHNSEEDIQVEHCPDPGLNVGHI